MTHSNYTDKENDLEKKSSLKWKTIAVSLFLLLALGTFTYLKTKANYKQDLGTYNDPEIAFKETQKALALLSNQINFGIKNVYYVEEYQNSKNLIFKPY